MDIPLLAWILLGVAVVALIVLLVSRAQRHKRTRELRDRFGPEYDRTVARAGSRQAAETELRDRQQRHERLRLRTLDAEEHRALHVRWEEIQASFVDGPESAVRGAEVVLDDTARARGYPDADAEQRLRDLAVDHSDEVDAYRRASRPTDRKGNAERHDAESLRRSLLAARALFEAIIGPEPEDARDDAPPAPFEDADRAERPAAPAADAGTAGAGTAGANTAGAGTAGATATGAAGGSAVARDAAGNRGDDEPATGERGLLGARDAAPAARDGDGDEPGDPDRSPVTGGVVPDERGAAAPEAPFDRVLGGDDTATTTTTGAGVARPAPDAAPTDASRPTDRPGAPADVPPPPPTGDDAFPPPAASPPPAAPPAPAPPPPPPADDPRV